jgi:hypothetical protein
VFHSLRHRQSRAWCDECRGRTTTMWQRSGSDHDDVASSWLRRASRGDMWHLRDRCVRWGLARGRADGSTGRGGFYRAERTSGAAKAEGARAG